MVASPSNVTLCYSEGHRQRLSRDMTPGRTDPAATTPSQQHMRSTRGHHGLVTTNAPSSQSNAHSTAQLPVNQVVASRCCANHFTSCSDALLLSAANVPHAEHRTTWFAGRTRHACLCTPVVKWGPFSHWAKKHLQNGRAACGTGSTGSGTPAQHGRVL